MQALVRSTLLSDTLRSLDQSRVLCEVTVAVTTVDWCIASLDLDALKLLLIRHLLSGWLRLIGTRCNR